MWRNRSVGEGTDCPKLPSDLVMLAGACPGHSPLNTQMKKKRKEKQFARKPTIRTFFKKKILSQCHHHD